MKRLSIPIIVLVALAFHAVSFAIEVSAQCAEVKFRGIVATDEEWGGFVCYGSYWCYVTVDKILHDPNGTLLLGFNVPVCYSVSLSLKVGELVECYGCYWIGECPFQYCGRVVCTEDPYYVMRPPHGPKAEFTAIPETVNVGELVRFNASASTSGWNGTHEMPITEYRWDFGGGIKITTSSPILYYSFISPGTYYATLTVYAPGATPDTDSTTKKVTITAISIGSYSFPIKGHTTEKPLTPYLAIVAILTVSFTMIRRKTCRRIKQS